MSDFLLAFLAYTGMLLALSGPIMILAVRRGKAVTARRFVVAAGVVGLFAAAIAASSKRIEEQCRGAGNHSCFDIGSTGSLVVVIGIFGLTAFAKAFFLYRD